MTFEIKKMFLTFFIFIGTTLLSSCVYESDVIVIGEGAWESNEFYNYVAKIIIEEGFEKEVEIIQVETPILVESLIQGDIHVNIETWSENIPSYNQNIDDGYYEEIAINFDDNEQGIFIPMYLHEEYGIETLQDLVSYKDIFEQEDGKAIIYGGTSGWDLTDFLNKKFSNEEDYPELVENFIFKPINSTGTLNATLIDAYSREEPWVGYNWKPTAVMGKYDMYLLEDEISEYNTETGTGNIPTNKVTVVVTKGFDLKHPEIYEFLSNFETESKVASDALSYMEENNLDGYETAKWWLNENTDYWKDWVSEDIYNIVINAIK